MATKDIYVPYHQVKGYLWSGVHSNSNKELDFAYLEAGYKWARFTVDEASRIEFVEPKGNQS